MKLNFGIIEDNELQAQDLERKILIWGNVSGHSCTVVHANSEKEFEMKMSIFLQCGILFFDIQLSEHILDMGIKFAQKIRNAGYKNYLVFLTSHLEFALRGYSVQAFDYLVKPIQQSKVAALMKHIIQDMDLSTVFPFSINRRLMKISYSDICYFAADRHKIRIYIMPSISLNSFMLDEICTEVHKNQSEKNSFDFISYVESFKQLIQKLEDIPIFVQSNRGYVLNINHINKLEKNIAYMENGSKLEISRSNLEQIRKSFLNSNKFIKG